MEPKRISTSFAIVVFVLAAVVVVVDVAIELDRRSKQLLIVVVI